MAQCVCVCVGGVKTPAVQAEDLSSIPRIYMPDGEKGHLHIAHCPMVSTHSVAYIGMCTCMKNK